MSRLADRILSSCRKVQVDDIVTDNDLPKEQLQATFKEKFPRLPESERKKLIEESKTQWKKNQPKAVDDFDYEYELSKAPIIAADDVGFYFSTLTGKPEINDLASTLAPPFDNFFIEFQKVPNIENLHAWGVLFSASSVEDAYPADRIKQLFEKNGHVPRWVLFAAVFIERQKGQPVGPIAYHCAALAEDGTWYRQADNSLIWEGSIPELSMQLPEGVSAEWNAISAQLCFPALLAISFMHCKNAEIVEVIPNDKLSKKAKKRTGRDLVRYHTLEIDPIKKIFKKYKHGTINDLKHAFHICRGHFKTFTEDSPLFGRHTGTFWWTPQVKGRKSEGIIVKDYRVLSPAILGKTYKIADERPPDKQKKIAESSNPDAYGRGLTAHNKTQNIIAETVRKLGWQPLSPKHDEPEFDLAWKIDNSLFVCEVKSLTKINEEKQLRLALGQVIRYKQKLAALGHEPVFSVIATEIEPFDRTWHQVMEQEGIILMWTENHHIVLQQLTELITQTKGNS